jgi:hypothetical protein
MRQLLVGAATTPVAVSYSGSLLADGAIDVQKKDSNGVATSLVAGDTLADAPEIRFCQGTSSENIVTPWISGRNIVVWNGKSYAAPQANPNNTVVLDYTGNSTAASTIDVKVIKIGTNGIGSDVFKNYTVSIPSGSADTAAGTLIRTAVNNDLPKFLESTTDGSATTTYTTYSVGDLDGNGERITEAYAIKVIYDFTQWDADGQPVATDTETVVATMDKGVGNGYVVAKLEDELAGSGFGYYNRILRPKGYNDAAGYTGVAGEFDMFTIVATKDGSTSPQIKGVDNLMEIYVALDNSTAAVTSAFIGALNPYMNAQGFANVNV